MLYIEFARRQRGWSQRDLGEHPRVRITQSFISQIERGVSIGTPEQRDRIARALGLAPELLLRPVPDDLPEAVAEASARG